MNASWENSQGQSLNEAVLLALNDLDRSQREQAIERAAETVDPEQLVGLIATEDVLRRNAALEALTRGGRRSVPALVRALDDPDPEVVMFAASTLGKTLDPSAIPPLAKVLRHSDVNVCQAAIESLGALRAVSTLSTLGELLGRDGWLRFSVVHTLGEIGDPSSAPDPDWPARRQGVARQRHHRPRQGRRDRRHRRAGAAIGGERLAG